MHTGTDDNDHLINLQTVRRLNIRTQACTAEGRENTEAVLFIRCTLFEIQTTDVLSLDDASITRESK